MIPDLGLHSERQWIVSITRHRRLVAFGTWALFAIIGIAYGALAVRPSEPPVLKDLFAIMGPLASATAVALLVLAALRLNAENTQVRCLAEAIVTNSPVGILMLDRHGQITWLNPALAAVFEDREPMGIVGKVLADLPTLEEPLMQAQIQRVLSGEAFALEDYEYTTVNGKTVYLSTNGVPLCAPDGSPNGAMLFIENTTIRRKWQVELENRSAELIRRSHEMEMLRDISLAITSTLELDAIVNLVYERVAPLVEADSFFIALTDDTRSELNFELFVNHGAKVQKLQELGPQSALCEWVIDHGRPLLIDDWQDRRAVPATLPAVELPCRSWLGVPLRVRERMIGVMAVLSDEPQRFATASTRLLDAVANEISIVIDNARLYRQTRARADELAAQHEITRAINSSLDLNQVLHLFFEQLHGVFQNEAGALLLLDPATDELVFEVVHGGAGSALAHRRMSSHDGIVGWVTQHGEALVVPDVRQDTRWFNDIDQRTSFTTRTIVAAPIRAKDRTIGAVELINRAGGNPFTTGDQKLLERFVDSAGIALENARLYQQTEKRLAQMMTINNVAGVIARHLAEAELYPLLAASIRPLLASRSCSIHLLDAKTQALCLAGVDGSRAGGSAGTAPISLGEGILGRVAQSGQMMYIPSPDQAPEDLTLPEGTGCLLAVPILGRDAVLGTLCLEHAETCAVVAEDQHLVGTVAAYIAAAIENRHLESALSERAARLEQAYQELSEIDRLKSEFVQNVSHELRTPLTFVKGYVELVRAGAFGALPERAATGMQMVSAKTDALINLVNDILALEQADAGSIKLEPVDIEDIVRSSVRAAAGAAAQAHVNLCENMVSPLPCVTGDAAQLARVMENLIGNAIKFSPDGGEVLIRALAEPASVQIQVQDHGIGIPADQIERIFERFYQVDGSTTRRFGGTGLGLAIVKQIVEAHHGRVWCESTLNQGSTFFVILPACGPDQGIPH